MIEALVLNYTPKDEPIVYKQKTQQLILFEKIKKPSKN